MRASVRGVVPYLDVAQGVGVVDDALDRLTGDVEHVASCGTVWGP